MVVRGTIDLPVRIRISSNSGRDLEEDILPAGNVERIFGGAEEWVDDTGITIYSSKAKGTLQVRLYCGARLKEEDFHLIGSATPNKYGE